MSARGFSLRFRLMAGAGTLGALAILAAFLAAYGIRQSLWLGEEAAAAQRRMEAYAELSASVTGMMLMPPAERGAAAERVQAGFDRLDDLVAEDVARVQGTAALNRAPQGQALARMQGAVLRLVQDLATYPEAGTLRDAAMNSFALVFSPLMREQVDYNRMRRNDALASLDNLRTRMIWLAGAVALAVPVLLVLLQALVIRPLLARLSTATETIATAGAGGRPHAMPLGGRDELALLFARLNQMIARLDRRHTALAADRAALETLVAGRTAALAGASAKLARTDEDRRRFFTDVSHELRSPLTVILAEAELAAAACPPTLEPTLAIIRTRAMRLNRRIEDLLRIARSDSGQLELDRRATSLSAALDGALEDIRPLLNRAHFRVERHAIAPSPVHADPDWLRQIAGGIIGNAVKHGGPGHVLKLTTGTESGESFCEISDDGPGLPQGDGNLVPQRFSATAAPGSFGIGLALAQCVTEMHGGRLTVQSPVSDGRGFAVRIILPQLVAATPPRMAEGIPA